MEFRFEVGGGGMRPAPVIHMLGWRCVKRSANGLSFRPGAGTLKYRLMALALGAVLMGITHLALTPLMAGPQPVFTDAERAQIVEMQFQLNELARELTDNDRERIADRAEVRSAHFARAQEQAAWMHRAAGTGYTVLMVLFGVCGLLPVVSLAWNRVNLWTDAGGRLMIHRWGLFPRTRTIPIASLGGIQLAAREHVERWPSGKHSSVPYSAGWRWRLRLMTTAGGRAAEFVLLHERDRPRDGAPPPEPVRLFADTLERMTGLRCTPPVVEDSARLNRRGGAARHSLRRDSFSTHIPLDDPGALDELPPALRAQVEAALRGEGGASVSHFASTAVTVTDEQGRTRSYDSIEDLPPDIRARLDNARVSERIESNSSITVHDEHGNVHHYGSPEEMPPDMRALLDKLRGDGGQAESSRPWE